MHPSLVGNLRPHACGKLILARGELAMSQASEIDIAYASQRTIIALYSTRTRQVARIDILIEAPLLLAIPPM